MKLLVIDGMSILYRSFFAIRGLSNKNGLPTNALVGFMNTYFKLKEKVGPDGTVVAFDLKTPTFRHKKYDLYKANRKPMPDDLTVQVDFLKKILKYMGIPVVTCEGYEADDIIGTLSKSSDKDNHCYIASGDRDLLQLSSDTATVCLSTNKEIKTYTPDKVKEDFNVSPEGLIELKGLMGDSSDNIPGVSGIGPKTASKLLEEYPSLDEIYENIDKLNCSEKIKTKLIEEKDNAFLSRELGRIYTDVPIETDYAKYKTNEKEIEKLTALLTDLELFQIMKKLDLKDENYSVKEKIEIKDGKVDLKNNKIIYLASKFAEGFSFESAFVTCDNVVEKIDDEKRFQEVLKSKSKIVAVSSKEIYRYACLKNLDIKLESDFMLISYIINPSVDEYNVIKYAEKHSKFSFDDEKTDQIEKQAVCLSLIYEDLLKQIKENKQEDLLFKIEMPLSKVLAQMETDGFSVDKKGISDFGDMLSEKIADLEKNVFEMAGHEFNLNSPKQLAVVLFEELGIKGSKKTKTGYSTAAEVLEKLKFNYPIVEDILKYRTYTKLKSTYCDGLLKVVDEDSKIHSTLNQTETRTGRISSKDPNLQNIPVREELGREMRKFFVAPKDCVLIDADYSQIELRVLAHISDDKNMIDAFKENKDIHTITASQVFKVPFESVNSVLRSRAKAVNFGIIYGIGAYSLSQDIGVPIYEAEEYINSYLNHYKDIDKYMNDTIKKAKKDGYVETIFNRRRYLPELKQRNKMVVAAGERIARNMPIQGTAADIIKIAMIKVYDEFKANNMKSKIIMQVHDELIVQAPNDEAKKAEEILKTQMENAVKLSVPLVVSTGVGKTWFEAKD